MIKCIGFGEYENKCTHPRYKNLYWCKRCNLLRVTHISKQFDELSKEAKGVDK